MPLITDIDKKGCFVQFGQRGKKYYYPCENERELKRARRKALQQARAMGYFNIEDINEVCEIDLSEEKIELKAGIAIVENARACCY